MHTRVIFFIIIFLCSFNIIYAQSEDDNVIITDRSEIYTFVEKNGIVTVKEKSETDYECIRIGTGIPVVEMYNNQITIDKVDTKRKATPWYNMYTSDDMFYSDAKICHFNLPFDRKGATAQVKFEKTYKDPRYFTSVYLSEMLYVKQKTITFYIPDWMKAELIERNFGKNITKEVKIDEKNKGRIYIYTITDEAAMKMEDNMPGRSHIYPHILVLTKSAMVNGEKVTYFETLDDQYAWYHNIVKEVNNDKTIIKSKSDEITKDCKTDEEKVKALFAWVQGNIRYIAFEDGIAGFKPDDAQEVLRKKYGDCKGMSNLLKALLEAQRFDARLAWLGTNHLAYDYSMLSLIADNHMICALFFEGKTYYLDPTVKYMPLGEYPHTIQGRQTLVEDKDNTKYLLNRIPEFSPQLNTDSLYCEFSVKEDSMQGRAVQYYKGESKQVILSLIDATPKDKQDIALRQFLENFKTQDKASGVQSSGMTSQSEEVKISYDLVCKSGFQSIDKEYYIDLDIPKELMSYTIDTTKRVNDIDFSYKRRIVKHIVLNIPEGYTVSHIPPEFDIKTAGYHFHISYKQDGGRIIYRKELTLLNTLLKKDQFVEWNSNIARLKNAYMEQLTLIKL